MGEFCLGIFAFETIPKFTTNCKFQDSLAWFATLVKQLLRCNKTLFDTLQNPLYLWLWGGRVSHPHNLRPCMTQSLWWVKWRYSEFLTHPEMFEDNAWQRQKKQDLPVVSLSAYFGYFCCSCLLISTIFILLSVLLLKFLCFTFHICSLALTLSMRE